MLKNVTSQSLSKVKHRWITIQICIIYYIFIWVTYVTLGMDVFCK